MWSGVHMFEDVGDDTNDDKVDDNENTNEIASVVCGPMMPSTLLIVLLVQWTSLWIDFT